MPEGELGGVGGDGSGGGSAEGSSWWDDFWEDVGKFLDEGVKPSVDDHAHPPKHHHRQPHHEHFWMMPEPVRAMRAFGPSEDASPMAHYAYDLWMYHFPNQHPRQHFWTAHRALGAMARLNPMGQRSAHDNPKLAAALYDVNHPGAHSGLL
jgi:hypothetical protein